MLPNPTSITIEEFEHGWREEWVVGENGRPELTMVPLTAEEALHPEEHYHMTEARYQDLLCNDIFNILTNYLADRPGTIVTRNLLIQWDNLPANKKHAPDISVIPNVADPTQNWTTFDVEEEGTRPVLAIEIVSKSSRKADREIKVQEYAQAGVQEYVYIDYWQSKNQMHWKIVGYRLIHNYYQPISADEDGAIHCRTIRARIGIADGRVWMEDERGYPLWKPADYKTAHLVAEEKAEQEEVARLVAEEKAAQEAAARLAAEEKAAQEAAARLAAEEKAKQAEEKAEQEAAARLAAEEKAEQEASARLAGEARIAELEATLKRLLQG